MKRLLIVLSVFLLASFAAHADDDFDKTAKAAPQLIQKGPQKEWCPVCGMSIRLYYKTSHAVILTDKTTRQYCSMRCLAEDYDNISGRIKEILVTDAKTDKLINALKAFYVVGGNVSGTMSSESKIAFASETDARNFQKRHGGDIMNFHSAFSRARASLAADTTLYSMKKQKVVYPTGAKIYKSVCKDIDPDNFEHINNLKAYIKGGNVCGSLTEQQLQALTQYLWNVERDSRKKGFIKINVPDKEKSPVCGIIVSKYPRWTARITYKSGKDEKPLYFVGAKDMMKFILHPKKYGHDKIDIKTVAVTDYYSLKAIDGKKAYYVTGSDMTGPMGSDLIPFESEENAETFAHDHSGKSIIEFKKIKDTMLKP